MIGMRVACLSPSYLPIVGGTETSIRNQVIFLKKHGVLSEIITLCDRKKWQPLRHLETKFLDGTRVLTWPSYPFGLLRIASTRMLNVHLFPVNTSSLNKHLNQFDLLHFHDVVDLAFPLSCLPSRKPKIFTCDTLQESRKFYQLAHNNFMRRLLIRSANLFHVFSNVDARVLMALGAQKEDIRVVSHGVDVEEFRPRTGTLSRDFVHIVHVGRIERRKGAAALLQSIHIMKQQDSMSKRVKVSIAGEISDPRYYRELLAYKRRMQLDEVHFVGFVDDLPEWLRQADVFVCPSLSETLGIVNLEAMASGLPIVATSVGAIPDLILENQTGFLVPPGDSEALANRLSRLVTDDRLREEMGQKARSRAESSFSIDRIASRMFNIYRELVQRF